MMIDKKEMRDLHLFTLPVNFSGNLRTDQTVQDMLDYKSQFGFEGEDQIEVYGYPWYNEGLFPEDIDGHECFYMGNLVDVDLVGNSVIYRIIIDHTLAGENFYTLKKLAAGYGPYPVICARFDYENGSGTIKHPKARLYRIDFMIDDREIPFVFHKGKDND